MPEVTVSHEAGSLTTMIEKIDTSHLRLVGCVDLEWGFDEVEYPLPVFMFDDEELFQELVLVDKPVNRVIGLRPTYTNYTGGDLMTGAWEASINIPQDKRFGEGFAQTAQGNKDAYVFEQPLPYLLDHKLAYVHESDGQEVIMEREICEEPYKLVYAPAIVLEKLGRLAVH